MRMIEILSQENAAETFGSVNWHLKKEQKDHHHHHGLQGGSKNQTRYQPIPGLCPDYPRK